MLNQSVLVLNRHWAAVHVTNVRRALILVFGDHAKVVTDDYSTHNFESWRDLSQVSDSLRKIATPSFQIAVPEVIMLTRFSKFPPRQVKFSRRNIYTRDNYTCQYCGVIPPKDELTIDHVIPRSRGGKSTWDNVVLACMRCNMKKGDRMPGEIGLKLPTQPRKPHWLECSHFQVRPNENSLWQKFLDNAYWNVPLQE
ncbi:MAG: HNH endonuclease [Candidatus Sumerlaeaceae bacterium]|nr:HNH endonuclease [Candidatus Sumerlaeaceae bacterium]